MWICVPYLDMILKVCTVVASALLQLLYLWGKVNVSMWLIKVFARICSVGSKLVWMLGEEKCLLLAGFSPWLAKLFIILTTPDYSFSLFIIMKSKMKNVLLLHNIIYFSSKSNLKSTHILEFSHCTHILDTISSGTRFPVV